MKYKNRILGKEKHNKCQNVESIWIWTLYKQVWKICLFRASGKWRFKICNVFCVENTKKALFIQIVCLGIKDLGFIHKTLNHNKEFVDKENEIITNSIEGTWLLWNKPHP